MKGIRFGDIIEIRDGKQGYDNADDRKSKKLQGIVEVKGSQGLIITPSVCEAAPGSPAKCRTSAADYILWVVEV